MPVTKGRKAIRFKSIEKMNDAISRDDEYQHRHLIIRYLHGKLEGTTRRDVSESTGVPVNAVTKVVSMLIEEGAIQDTGPMVCPYSGRNSKGIAFCFNFKGPY